MTLKAHMSRNYFQNLNCLIGARASVKAFALHEAIWLPELWQGLTHLIGK